MGIKYLIVGRTCTGKDTLVNHLCSQYHYKRVLSYTTRPPRYDDEDTHIFISKEKAAGITDKLTETAYADHAYFITKQQIQENDLIIAEPTGVWDILKTFPDTAFAILYIKADDENARKQLFFARQEADENQWNRIQAEDNAKFDAFEQIIFNKNTEKWPSNLIGVTPCKNQFDQKSIETLGEFVHRHITKHRNTEKITRQLAAVGKLAIDADDNIILPLNDGTTEKIPISICTEFLLSRPNDFSELLQIWLSDDKTIIAD